MSKAITVQNVSTQVREWAPGLKDFALTNFDQQRFFKTAIMAITETPSLMECMQTPAGQASLYSAMKRAFSTGLSLNPQEGKAAIIAYKGKASYQIMKEGAIEILLRSGDIKNLIVEIVYENDIFEIEKTSSGDKYTFKPARKNRGSVDGYFCSMTDNDDVSHIKYMTEDECFEVRDNYSEMYNSKAKSYSPWTKSEKGMCKKTVIKAAIRDLHISPKTKSIFSSEDMSFQDNQPEMKDITPDKMVGTNAADVTKKITQGKKPVEKSEEKETAETGQNQEDNKEERF